MRMERNARGIMTDNLAKGDGFEGTEGPSYGEWLRFRVFVGVAVEM